MEDRRSLFAASDALMQRIAAHQKELMAEEERFETAYEWAHDYTADPEIRDAFAEWACSEGQRDLEIKHAWHNFVAMKEAKLT